MKSRRVGLSVILRRIVPSAADHSANFDVPTRTSNSQLPIASDSSDQLLIRNFDSRASRPPAVRSWHCGCNEYGSIRLDTSETFRSSRAFVRIRWPRRSRSAVSPHAWPSSIGTFLSTASEWNFGRRELRGSRRREQRKIVLRELKETKFRLRVLRRCAFLTRDQEPVIRESDELIKIVATLLRNSNA